MVDRENRVEPCGGAAQFRRDDFLAVSAIFDAAEIIVYVADMETYELLFLNKQAQVLWGANNVGRRCYEVLQTGQSAPCPFCNNDRLLKDGRPGPPLTWEFQNTANERWYLCVDKAIPWHDDRWVRMEVAVDITERKAHEQFREEYGALVSHDLRSPLSAIAYQASALKLLLEKHNVRDGMGLVTGILDNGRRMKAMIDSLLDTCRLESGRLALKTCRFDLNVLSSAVVAHLGAQAARRIDFRTDGRAVVLADPLHVERVLENLIGNAIRYSPRDTSITVRVTASGGEGVFTVADHGNGISRDVLPKLFQRFYRAPDSSGSVQGLGLGLYISRMIVESHGGRIWVESEPGAGSIFGFTLPLAPPE